MVHFISKAFSPDSRWLVTASMDCLIKVWDLPTGKLIDCFRFDKAPTSVCYSPTAEFLATAHVNDLGVYLWSNKTLYSHVSFRHLPEDYEPAHQIAMPLTKPGETSGQEGEASDAEDASVLDDYKEYVSPEHLDLDLISLSLLPDSRWKNLINLDIIKVIF
jgi:U3 small nucleolar RNA-associated protein 21